MKAPSFFEGVGIALASAFVGSILFTVLPSITGTRLALYIMISIISLGYLLYLLKRSEEHVGRWVVSLAWLTVTIAAWIWNPGMLAFCILNAAMIWLIRCLYFYNGILISLVDLLLILFGFAAAFWAMSNTQSLFLSIWCFFLAQALFPSLINLWATKPKQQIDSRAKDSFNTARKNAEAAIHKLSTTKLPL